MYAACDKLCSVKIKVSTYAAALLIALAACIFAPVPASGDTIDRIVAIVDSHAITERELNAMHGLQARGGDKADTLEEMINRYLILREAKLLRIEGEDSDEVFGKYISLKVRTLISVTDGEARRYYWRHKNDFGSAGFDAVKGEIKAIIEDRKTAEKLSTLLKELRSKAEIIVLVGPD